MFIRRVVGPAVLSAVALLYAAAASALPPSGTEITKCNLGDSKINGLCYGSCGANVVAGDYHYCISNCPKSSYTADGNKCQECQTHIENVSSIDDCGGRPCGPTCDVRAGGMEYYCPLYGGTVAKWCCTFPPRDADYPRFNSKGAVFSGWALTPPDYDNGHVGPNVYTRCAEWSSPLILRSVYTPTVVKEF
jgi:hypothetical protein